MIFVPSGLIKSSLKTVSILSNNSFDFKISKILLQGLKEWASVDIPQRSYNAFTFLLAPNNLSTIWKHLICLKQSSYCLRGFDIPVNGLFAHLINRRTHWIIAFAVYWVSLFSRRTCNPGYNFSFFFQSFCIKYSGICYPKHLTITTSVVSS